MAYYYYDLGMDSSDDEQREIDLIEAAYEEGFQTGKETRDYEHQLDLKDCFELGREEGYREGILEMLEEELKEADDGKEIETPEELLRQREINKLVNATLEAEAAARDYIVEDWDFL